MLLLLKYYASFYQQDNNFFKYITCSGYFVSNWKFRLNPNSKNNNIFCYLGFLFSIFIIQAEIK